MYGSSITHPRCCSSLAAHPIPERALSRAPCMHAYHFWFKGYIKRNLIHESICLCLCFANATVYRVLDQWTWLAFQYTKRIYCLHWDDDIVTCVWSIALRAIENYIDRGYRLPVYTKHTHNTHTRMLAHASHMYRCGVSVFKIMAGNRGHGHGHRLCRLRTRMRRISPATTMLACICACNNGNVLCLYATWYAKDREDKMFMGKTVVTRFFLYCQKPFLS